MREDLKACILITRKQGRTALGKGARAALEASGLPVLSTEIGQRIAFQEAIAAGQGITRFAPRDAGSTEITNLLDELENLVHGKKASGRFPTKAAAAG
jgi:chromosome partitioning protein